MTLNQLSEIIESNKIITRLLGISEETTTGAFHQKTLRLSTGDRSTLLHSLIRLNRNVRYIQNEEKQI